MTRICGCRHRKFGDVFQIFAAYLIFFSTFAYRHCGKMKKFLEYVAEDIISKYGTDLSRIAVVFPNKRASLFLNELLAKHAGRPVWSPAYITISEFFSQHSSLTVGDPIKLTCDIYKSFIECTGMDETLDHFYGWGQMLISDFDDIDKNMADASDVFRNITNLHELDDISYLDEEQKEILKRFFSNFTDGNETELKRRFMQLWCHLEDIYNNFRRRLRQQGIAYEGMLYREVATDTDIDFRHDTYLFVGFNVIQKVEQQIFSRLQKDGKARFYWDFDNYYMPTGKPSALPQNEAGHYVSQYIRTYPNELDTNDDGIYNNLRKNKSITYVSASTENVQARYINTWLKENGRYNDGRNVAIVLCDESLLATAIHCIPEEVGSVNITTGYPLSLTAISSFVLQLLDLRINGYSAAKGTFRLKHVIDVLSHPYSQYISDKCQTLKDTLVNERIYHPTPAAISPDSGLSTLFSPPDGSIPPTQWLMNVLRLIAGKCGKAESDPLTQESLFRMYTLCNRIDGLVRAGDLNVDVITLQKLIMQLINSTSIPFHGEPVQGIQIMGILETRNIDFDHVLILSCNEGNMPKGINDSSFIPYSIRKANGLTTIDNKVAIYAYYFYNLIQRADDITIAYNSSTDSGHTGEMSRFMLQLMIESGHNIRRISLKTGQRVIFTRPVEIQKDGKTLKALDDLAYISPTSINRYIRCPLQFYFNNIAKIDEPEDDPDEMSSRVFGNVFHNASEILYKQLRDKKGTVTREAIEYALKHKELIAGTVDNGFAETILKGQTGRLIEYNGLQLINREVIIRYIERLLQIDLRLTPLRINDVEASIQMDSVITTSNGKRTVKIGGRIDRLDQINDEENGGQRLRIIDYKTGRYLTKSINTVYEIFSMPPEQGKHADYFLQTMLYACIIRHDKALNQGNLPVSPALLFIQYTSEDDYDPTLAIGKKPITDIAEYEEEFTERLRAVVSEIFEPDVPFRPTADKTACGHCPYSRLCGL